MYNVAIRRNFADSEKRKVEDMLDDFVYYLFVGFKLKREQEEESKREEEEQNRREEIRRQEEIRIQAEKEEMERKRIEKENMIKSLVSFSYDYKKSQVIRDFIEQVRAVYSGNKELEEQLTLWISWAAGVVQTIDPFESKRFNEYIQNFVLPDNG